MDTLKVEIGKRFVKVITDFDLWELLLILILIGGFIFILGGFFSWLIRHKLIRSETKKLISEAEVKAIEKAEKRISLIEKCFVYKKKYDENSRLLSLSLRANYEYMKEKDFINFDKQREEALNIFYSDFFPSFIEYYQIIQPTFMKEEKIEFIEVELFPFLETIRNFFDVINLDIVLSKINRTPAFIKRTNLSFIIFRIKKDISIFNRRLRKKYKENTELLEKYYG